MVWINQMNINKFKSFKAKFTYYLSIKLLATILEKILKNS